MAKKVNNLSQFDCAELHNFFSHPLSSLLLAGIFGFTIISAPQRLGTKLVDQLFVYPNLNSV